MRPFNAQQSIRLLKWKWCPLYTRWNIAWAAQGLQLIPNSLLKRGTPQPWVQGRVLGWWEEEHSSPNTGYPGFALPPEASDSEPRVAWMEITHLSDGQRGWFSVFFLAGLLRLTVSMAELRRDFLKNWFHPDWTMPHSKWTVASEGEVWWGMLGWWLL